MTIRLSGIQTSSSATKGTIIGVLGSSKLGDTGVQFTVLTGNDLFVVGGSSRNSLVTNWVSSIAAGVYSITIVASKGAASDSGTFDIVVTSGTALPVPSTVVLIPTSKSLQSNTASGTALSSITVVMSDSSVFSGTLASSDSLVSIVGKNLQLSRALTAVDVGSRNVIITASQNGGSVNATFVLTVTAIIVVVPSSVVLTPSAATLQDNATIGTVLCTAAVSMSDGSAFSGTLSSSDSLAAISGLSVKLSRGLSSSDDGLHNITITATQNGASRGAIFALTVIAMAPPSPVTNLPGSPLPLFDPFGGGKSQHSPGIDGMTGHVAVVSGTVIIKTIAWGAAGPPSSTGTVTAQWMLDGGPLSGYITDTFPYRFNYSWDTTTASDGTHVITARFIDADTFSVYNSIAPMGMTFIVQNQGAKNGPQTLPATFASLFPVVYPGLPDFINYSGKPWVANATHILSTPTVGFVPPLNGGVGGRDSTNWRADDPAEPRMWEYRYNVRLATTPKGGVWLNETQPEAGNYPDFPTYRKAELRGGLDGGRCDATLDPYITYIPSPDGLSWYGCELMGRIVRVDFDGRVTTIYGNRFDRAKLPYDANDADVSGGLNDDDIDSRFEFVGSGNLEVGGATDICFDPRNPDVLYFVNPMQHYIGKVIKSTGVGTVYAGISGVSGFLNGSASVAKFNFPTSIIMSDGTGNGGPAGTMYVADMNNNCIRMISADGSIVSTLVGKQGLPNDATIAASPSTYSPPGTVTGYANIYITHPFTIRWSSARNIIVARTQFMRVSEINLAVQTDRLIGYYGEPPGTAAPRFTTSAPESWIWIDCDYAGACGPVDDIVMVLSAGSFGSITDAASANWRLSFDGTKAEIFTSAARSTAISVGSPPVGYFVGGFGHYPWAIAFSRTQARMIGSGFAINGAGMLRYKVASDPPFDTSATPPIGWDVWSHYYGDLVYATGTASSRGQSVFPWNSRPSFAVLRGHAGCGHTGVFGDKSSFDDLVAAFPSNMPGDAGDMALADYIRSGMGGSAPRPEITGNDMRDLIYFIRRNTLAGSFPVIVNPGRDDPDRVAPIITSMSARRVNATTIHIDWTTDKSTIGFVAVGSPNQAGKNSPYCVFSPIEGSYGSSHSMDVPGCPTAVPTHFSVVAKDVAGNATHTADASVP